MKLMQGDCLELMKEIPDGSVDMVLCDPPYGTTRCKWDSVIPLEPMWNELKRVLGDGAPVLLFGSQPFSSTLIFSNIKWYRYDWVWDKKSTTGFLNAKIRPLRRHEFVHVFCKKKPPYNPIMEIRGKPRNKVSYNKKIGNGDMVYGSFLNVGSVNNVYYPTDILEFSNAVQKGKVHPTQKPVMLLEYLINTYTQKGQTVLDFTMGSGSTGVACVNTGRDFIGIELDEGYFEVAKQRIAEAQERKDSEEK